MSPGKNNLSQKRVVVQHVNPAFQMGTVAYQIVPSFKAAAPELKKGVSAPDQDRCPHLKEGPVEKYTFRRLPLLDLNSASAFCLQGKPRREPRKVVNRDRRQ